MTEARFFTLTKVMWEAGGAVAPFTTAAVSGDTVILAAADELFQLGRAEAPATVRVEKKLRLSFVPDRVGLSPTGRYLLAGDRVRLEVWDRQAVRRVADFWAGDPRRFPIRGGFARVDARELLVWNDEGSNLRGYDLDACGPAFSCRAETFRLAASPLALGDHLLLVGYFHGETKESLTVVDLAQMLGAPDSIADHFQHKRGIQDHAYRLCAGAAGDDSLVAFRDPEEDEDEPADEDDAQRSYDDVWGLRGLYVRRVGGALVERIAWSGPVESFASIASSAALIAIACTDGIHIVAHTGGEITPPIDARWLAASPDGAEILVQTPQGDLAWL